MGRVSSVWLGIRKYLQVQGVSGGAVSPRQHGVPVVYVGTQVSCKFPAGTDGPAGFDVKGRAGGILRRFVGSRIEPPSRVRAAKSLQILPNYAANSTEQMNTAAAIPAMSAVSPAASACRMRRICAAPK